MFRGFRTVLLAAGLTLVSVASYAGGLNPFGPSGMPLTQGDFAQMAVAVDPLLNDETTPLGTSRDWKNDQSGNHGSIKLLQRFQYKYNGAELPCKKLEYTVIAKGNADPYKIDLNRCKVDGAWKFL
jgi:surface antigen